MKQPLDTLDYQILSILQENANITNAQLAVQIGLAPASTLERVRKLEKQGVIQGYRALLDSCQLGIHMKVWLLVQLHGLSASHVLTFKKAIDHLPAVITCIQVMGNADFLLQVVTKDMYSYKDFLENELSNIEQIKNIVAMPVVYSMKEKGLPLLNKFQKNTKPQN